MEPGMTCKGSVALGSGCMKCEKCIDELKRGVKAPMFTKKEDAEPWAHYDSFRDLKTDTGIPPEMREAIAGLRSYEELTAMSTDALEELKEKHKQRIAEGEKKRQQMIRDILVLQTQRDLAELFQLSRPADSPANDYRLFDQSLIDALNDGQILETEAGDHLQGLDHVKLWALILHMEMVVCAEYAPFDCTEVPERVALHKWRIRKCRAKKPAFAGFRSLDKGLIEHLMQGCVLESDDDPVCELRLAKADSKTPENIRFDHPGGPTFWNSAQTPPYLARQKIWRIRSGSLGSTT